MKYLVVLDIIAIIPVNKRQKLNWLDNLTDDQTVKKLPKSVLADITWHRHLKQGTPVVKYMFFNKKGAMYVQKRRSMVARSKK